MFRCGKDNVVHLLPLIEVSLDGPDRLIKDMVGQDVRIILFVLVVYQGNHLVVVLNIGTSPASMASHSCSGSLNFIHPHTSLAFHMDGWL